MKKIDSNLDCPSCHGPLSPRVLACDGCGVRVEGPFTTNEFAGLSPDILHFLRIFVHCEGRIKDMEKALGVSYPTVKAMMAQLKKALDMPEGTAETASAEPTAPAKPAPDPMTILESIERGDVAYDEGLRRLKTTQRKKSD